MNEEATQDVFVAVEPYPYDSILASAVKLAFENPYWSVIVVDKQYSVRYMDPITERLFKLSPGGALGRDIRELAPDSDFQLAIADGTPVAHRIKDMWGVRRITGVYPLRKDGEIIGALGRTSFDSVDEIETAHKKIALLEREIRNLRQRERNEHSSAYTFQNILGTSPLIRETVATAKRISMLDADVLIEGESGTGKELFAHSIHNYRCNDKPFVKINCPAIPFELAESQLFGYEKGAYTGASPSGRIGVFEAANDGIVFLDEISSLPLSIQAKLLRVLQEREIQRVGSNKTVKVRFRFIASTNVNLLKLVTEGKFRNDLYYRVSGASLRIPSLRERPEDIPLYLHTFLGRINKSFKVNIKGYSKEAMDLLVRYPWPGNVRQLIHILEEIAITAWDATEVAVEHLPKEILSSRKSRNNATKTLPIGASELDNEERDSIIAALRRTGGNKRQAARHLNMSRVTLYKKMKRYGVATD